MHGNSRPVSSNQTGIHPQLKNTLLKHNKTDFLQVIKPINQEVFQQILPIQQQSRMPLIVDSGCGNGNSSKLLASQNPDHLIIGVDKSPVRMKQYLNHNSFYHQDNLILMRSDLIDFWRIAATAGWKLSKHYFLYPNPWPKKKHLNRRWYAHPVFRSILQLGGKLECRSNWSTYIEEFSLALEVSGHKVIRTSSITPDGYLTPFEKKYHHSGHMLHQLNCDLSIGTQ